MTEVPNTILWIASVGLITLTVLMCALIIALLLLTKRVKQLVEKLHEVAEPLKDAAKNAGNTVSTFSNSLLRPIATIAGMMAGFRRGADTFGGKKAKKRK